MKTYLFPFGKATITVVNPIITILSVLDRFSEKQCIVNVVLDSGGNKVVVSLHGFTYIESWTNADIDDFVTSELVKHEVLPDPE